MQKVKKKRKTKLGQELIKAADEAVEWHKNKFHCNACGGPCTLQCHEKCVHGIEKYEFCDECNIDLFKEMY